MLPRPLCGLAFSKETTRFWAQLSPAHQGKKRKNRACELLPLCLGKTDSALIHAVRHQGEKPEHNVSDSVNTSRYRDGIKDLHFATSFWEQLSYVLSGEPQRLAAVALCGHKKSRFGWEPAGALCLR